MSLRPAWLRSRQPPESQWLAPTRIRLMILLPLTMSLLVGATGFFALNKARRAITLHGSHPSELTRMFDQISVQVVLIAVIAAVLGVGLAVGVTAPLRAFADKLEAVASGDLSAPFDAKSAPEAEWLAGTFNDAIAAVNRYVFQSMTGAVITVNTEGVVIGSSPAAELILGCRDDEIVGRRFSEVFAPAGVGLGLAIARQIVTAYGGRIDVDSDEATGTTFAIELPLDPAEAHTAAGQAPGRALLTDTSRSV